MASVVEAGSSETTVSTSIPDDAKKEGQGSVAATASFQKAHSDVPRCPRDLFPQLQNPFKQHVPVTLYSFPEYKPVSTTSYPSSHLLLPLRRDILHRAVIFEGDNTRQGTASTKWRLEVHGSGRKIRPQKGTGGARLGDKKSPMLRGGGVAFGPKPRDFGTDLPRKIYDLAWRTALSYRYRRGELVVVDGKAEIGRDGPGTVRWVREMLAHNQWGKSDGGSLIVTLFKRDRLFAAAADAIEAGELSLAGWLKCSTVADVDVKDLLGMGRLIVERAALERMFESHTSDLKHRVSLAQSLSPEDLARLKEQNLTA